MKREKAEKLHFYMRKAGHKCRHLQMQHYQNIGDLRLLRIIVHHGENGITPSALADRMEVALPTISRKLSVLEKQQFIKRASCSTDKRKSFIYSTEKGRQLVEETWSSFITAFSNACMNMGEDKTDTLIELLREINENIDREIRREEGTD